MKNLEIKNQGLQNFRNDAAVWDTVFDRLSMFKGSYECHITIALEQGGLSRFEAICKELESNPILIILDSGKTPRQPMLAKVFNGKPEDVLADIQRLYFRVAQEFSVVRIKIEAGVDNTGVPDELEQISALPKDCYFEFHTRLCLAEGADLTLLRKLLKCHEGHLSNNALQKVGTIEKRFVTQRFRKQGRKKAELRLEKLISFLDDSGIKFDKLIKEFNIFDSNAVLDSGWENV